MENQLKMCLVLLQTLETNLEERECLESPLAPSTPLLRLVRNQKSCFSAWQGAGMKSTDCSPCWAWDQAAGFSQHVSCSCVYKGHPTALLPSLTAWILQRTVGQGSLSMRGSTCFWSAKGQSRDQHFAQSLLRCGATFPLFLKSTLNAFKNNYWKEQNPILFWTALASTQEDLRKQNVPSWQASHGRWLGL